MFFLLKVPLRNFLKTNDYLRLPVEITLGDLIKLFREERRDYGIFTRDGKPVGIITERDISKALYQRYPLEVKAFTLAKRELIKIRSSATILQAFNLMTENYIRRLIVVDEEGNLEGVITQKDLILYSTEEIFRGEARVRDILENKLPLIYATKEETLADAHEKLVKFDIGVLPILDEDFKPIGIISIKDLLQYQYSDWGKKLKELALKEVITIPINRPVTEAVQLFKKFMIGHLVVVDETGKAMNVVSQRDLVQNVATTYTKFLESTLKQAKEFISLIPETVLEFSECDSECRLTWMNDYAKQIIGESYLEKDVFSLFDYDDWTRIFGILKQEKVVIREKIKDRRGKIYEVTGTYLEFGDREGKIKLILRDMTDEYLKEKNYQEEIKLLKSFLDKSLDYIIVIDPQGRIIFANESLKKALGYGEREISEKTIFEIVDSPRDEIKKNIELLIKKGEKIKTTRFYRDIHQNLIPVEVIAQALKLNGNTFIIINARNIQDLWQDVEHLKRKLYYFETFYSFINELNLAKTEEELFQVLEKFLLKSIETLHFYEVDPYKAEIKSTWVKGKGSQWQDCLETSIKQCKVYLDGKPFLKKELECSFFPYENFYYLCIPLIFEGTIQGIVNLVKSDSFSEEEIGFLQDMIHSFNIYLNRLKLQNRYYELSIKDPLLGVYNRRFILEALNKECEKAKRLKRPFSIIIMDLDHFKKINDTMGHQVGDLVLKEFVALVGTIIREMDIFGRWGGEEFLLLLPETEKEKARIVAERIRENLEKHEILLSEKDKIKITASFGVAEFLKDALSPEFLIKKADERLYLAKELGRNRVVAD